MREVLIIKSFKMLREIISQKKPKTLNSYDVGEKKKEKKDIKESLKWGKTNCSRKEWRSWSKSEEGRKIT